MFGYAVIYVGLVYYFWDYLRHVVNQWRVRGGYFSAMYGVRGAIFDQERQESEYAVDEKGDYKGVDDEKNCKSTAHGCW